MVSAQGYIFRIFYHIRQQLFYTANLNQHRLKYANIPICDKHENRIYRLAAAHFFLCDFVCGFGYRCNIFRAHL